MSANNKKSKFKRRDGSNVIIKFLWYCVAILSYCILNSTSYNIERKKRVRPKFRNRQWRRELLRLRQLRKGIKINHVAQRAFRSFFHPPFFRWTCRINLPHTFRARSANSVQQLLLFKKDVQYAFYILSTIENPGRNHIWIQRDIWGK